MADDQGNPDPPVGRAAPDGHLCPCKVVTDAAGNLWVVDSELGRVIGMDGSGTVLMERDLDGGEDRAGEPCGLSISPDRGALYVALAGRGQVCRVDLTRLGQPDGSGERADGPAYPVDIVASELAAPWAVAVDEEAGLVYVAAADANQIWRVARGDPNQPSDGSSVLAGTGELGAGDGTFERASFARPTGMVLSPDRRRLYVVDSRPVAVRVVDLVSREVSTLADAFESAGESADEPAGEQRGLVHGPDIAIAPAGLVIADPAARCLYGVNPRHGTVVAMWRPAGDSSTSRPAGVAYERVTSSFIVADAGDRQLLRVSRDAQSTARIEVKGLS